MNQHRRPYLLALAGAWCLTSALQAQAPTPEKPSREIVVSATRSVDLAPDYAELVVGVTTRDTDAGRAGEQHARLAQAVRAALRALRFAAESLPTIGYQVHPEYERPRNRPVGYTVESRIQVRVHDLTRVGPVIDAALGAGANIVHGLMFESTRRDAARLEALAGAMQAAREEAEAMARAVGGRLGPLIEASSQQPFTIRGAAAERMAMASMQADTPITPGTLEISATVTTRWEFIPNP